MAKKYNPSGYQIISIDVTDKTSGTPFVPVTEDEKRIYDILVNGIEKPILMKLTTSNYSFLGFAIYDNVNGAIYMLLGSVGLLVSETLSFSDDKLTWVESEE